MILGRIRYMYIDISAILMLDFPSRDYVDMLNESSRQNSAMFGAVCFTVRQ